MQTEAAVDKQVVGPPADPVWSTSLKFSLPRIAAPLLTGVYPFNTPTLQDYYFEINVNANNRPIVLPEHGCQMNNTLWVPSDWMGIPKS